jgi:hypothetical protein
MGALADLGLAQLNPFAKEFFGAYLVDHFLFKFKILDTLVNGEKSLRDGILAGVGQVDDKKLMSSLRLEIRATLYQAIETLFELLFSLEPRAGRIDNRHLWYLLTDSKRGDSYERIADIAKGKIEFLNRVVVAGNGLECPYWRYVFFFNQSSSEAETDIVASGLAIKDLLIILAKEFSVREEYNAYKHGLRIMPMFNSFVFQDPTTKAAILTADMSTHMTFLSLEEQTVVVRSTPMDTQRDLRLGHVCWALISNIIETRHAYFNKRPRGKLKTFDPGMIGTIAERGVNTQGVDWRFRIVREEGSDDKANGISR